MMRTLWDLVDTPSPKIAAKPAAPTPAKTGSSSHGSREGGTFDLPVAGGLVRRTSAARYEFMQKEMLSRHGVRVRKWRSGTSGVAWQVYYEDGTISRLIESPRPRGPMSAAVFLHEIGHHAIGFETYRPRCLEELHAWRFALDQMEEWGIGITDCVRKRVHESLAYAVAKAWRRGIKRVPVELAPFAQGKVAPGCWADPRASVASGPS